MVEPKLKFPTKYGFQQWLKANPTRAELILGHAMQSHPMLKDKFQTQPILCGFIPDFYFPLAKTVIEVDGSIHTDPKVIKNDILKNNVFKSKGMKVLRFTNDQIYNDLRKVIFKICNCGCAKRRKRTKYKSFLLDHAPKQVFLNKRGSCRIRRKINPAGAFNPKPALLCCETVSPTQSVRSVSGVGADNQASGKHSKNSPTPKKFVGGLGVLCLDPIALQPLV